MDLDDMDLRQLDQRFPHRRAGEAQLYGQLVLTDLAAWGQGEIDDVLLDGPQGIIPAGLPGQAFQ